MEHEELCSFDMNILNEIRKLRAKMYRGRDNWLFWDELETIIKQKGYSPKEWKKKDKDNVVLGNVWEQEIGCFWYEKSVHEYTFLYTDSLDLVIDWHGHNKLTHHGKSILKTREWYTFVTDGRMEFCPKDKQHQLINIYGEPIYVVSTKITSCPRPTKLWNYKF